MENKPCQNKCCALYTTHNKCRCKLLGDNAPEFALTYIYEKCKDYTDQEPLKMPKMLSLWMRKNGTDSVVYPVERIDIKDKTNSIYAGSWYSLETFYNTFEPYTEE